METILTSIADMGSLKLQHYLIDNQIAHLNYTENEIMHWVINGQPTTYTRKEITSMIRKRQITKVTF